MDKNDLPRADVTLRPGLRSNVSVKALQRWNPDVRAASDEVASISILDVIGEDPWTGGGVTARRIAAALRQIGDQDVVVSINSPGGDFFEGLAIYNLLREHTARVEVHILSLAASAASVIAMAGDEVRIGRAAFLMLHNTWVLAAADKEGFREVADWLEPFDAAATEIYAARSGRTSDEIAKMINDAPNRDLWIGGQAAVDQGFADGLLPSDAVTIEEEQPEARALRAERIFDTIAAQSGLTRTENRALQRDLKQGTRGAAPAGKQDAAGIEMEISDLLSTLKTL
ncbi:head maturation protease, ClpP-related [Aestuariibius sp. 2305UL40-4]|uniref:head maturation protease, ClpP-related n=1 Tax=Aestuariibius violaceus TaxID=3234132 RepID=UPI00345E83A0